MLCLVLFVGGLGCDCVPGISGIDIKPGSCFRCAVFGAVPGRGGARFRTRNPRKRHKTGPCFRCAVFGAVPGVPGWFGVWLRTTNLRKRYNQGPVSDVLCLVLFLGGSGCGGVPGIPGKEITSVLFQMCCVWCYSWVDWGVVSYQESQEER